MSKGRTKQYSFGLMTLPLTAQEVFAFNLKPSLNPMPYALFLKPKHLLTHLLSPQSLLTQLTQ